MVCGECEASTDEKGTSQLAEQWARHNVKTALAEVRARRAAREPLESELAEPCTDAVQSEFSKTVQDESWNQEDETPTAAIDTGCQRMALGRDTCQSISSFLPSDMPVVYKAKQYRFRGVGGSTVTKQVACIPSNIGPKGSIIEPAVLEDTPGAPLLISLPLLRALGSVIDLPNGVIRFTHIKSEAKIWVSSRGQLVFSLFAFTEAQKAYLKMNKESQGRMRVGDECTVFHSIEETGDSSTSDLDSDPNHRRRHDDRRDNDVKQQPTGDMPTHTPTGCVAPGKTLANKQTHGNEDMISEPRGYEQADSIIVHASASSSPVEDSNDGSLFKFSSQLDGEEGG